VLRCVLWLCYQADLSSNMFSGPIPSALSQSAQLVYLNVSNNHLTDIEAPDAWSTPALLTLDASYNSIEGEAVHCCLDLAMVAHQYRTLRCRKQQCVMHAPYREMNVDHCSYSTAVIHITVQH